MKSQIEIMQLVIAYTLTGALVFTALITYLSLVGRIKFQDKLQQKQIFWLFIVQLCIIVAGFFSGLLKFNPFEVKAYIAARGADQFFNDLRRAKLREPDFRAAIDNDVDIQKIRLFLKTDEENDGSKHGKIIRDWLRSQGLPHTPVTEFNKSGVYAPLRSRMVADLGL
jgi:hypothetical protein